MTNVSTSLSSSFRRWLTGHLSHRVKRYFFLASFWSYIQNDESYDKETLKKLNEVMTLGSSEDSLFIPALLGKVIWRDCLGNVVKTIELESQVSQGNINPMIINKTLENIPDWLNYDKREVIEHDIKTMVHNMAVQ